MWTINKLPFEAIAEVSKIFVQAYPGARLSPSQYAERIQKHWEDPWVTYYGVYAPSDTTLVGGMRYHEFKMNCLGQMIDACGIGSVAVAMTHKKDKMAFTMLQHFLHHYRDLGYPMALLYPFEPGFYKRMGFGYGAPQHQYTLTPHQFPSSGDKSKVIFLQSVHAQLLYDFYQAQVLETHGLMDKHLVEFERLFDQEGLYIVGYFNDGLLQGYLQFRFEPSANQFLLNDMAIGTWLWSSPDAFEGLCAFIAAQEDQVRHIRVHTQRPAFHFSFDSAKDVHQELLGGVWHSVSKQGIGTMYRLLDIVATFDALKAHNFGNVTLAFDLHIRDTFLPENQGVYSLCFADGHLERIAKKEDNHMASEIALAMDVSDFTSLLICSVDFRTLYRLGRVRLDLRDRNLSKRTEADLQALFATAEPPTCLTAF